MFAAAIASLFADPNIARTAIYRPGGAGDGVSVRVIARRGDQMSDFAGTAIVLATARFDLRVAEVPSPVEGDAITFDGETFIVQGEPLRDAERLVWTIETRPV